MKHKLVLAAAATATLVGCATTTPTVERESAYVIYRIEPAPGVTAAQMSQAIQTALQKNNSSVQINRGILRRSNPRIRQAHLQKRDFRPGDGIGIRPDPACGTTPFRQNPLGPIGGEQARRRALQQDFPKHGREQHAGVQNRPHPSNRKNRALR